MKQHDVPEGFLAAVIGQMTNGVYQALQAAEIALCGEAAQAVSNASQNRLFETVSRIRLGRLRLTDRLAQVVADPDLAVPAHDAALAELVDMESAVAACQQQSGGALVALAPALGIEPARLASVLLVWEKEIALDAHAALLVFRAFRDQVFAALPGWSAEWAQALGLEVQQAAASVVAEGSSNEALLGLLDALQQEQQSLLDHEGAALDLAAIEQRLSDAGVAIDEDSRETLRLVARLFDFIMRASGLPASVSRLVGFLQVPLTKVALVDTSFFDREGHSARKLLNQIATASIGLGEGVTDDPVFAAMRQAVVTVLSGFGRDPSVFSDVLADFTTALERESEQAMQAEERLRSAEDLGARTESARSMVDETIAAVTTAGNVPPVVNRFLEQQWRKVLFLAFQQEGAEGEKWAMYRQVLDSLVWSVQPIGSAADRQKLLKLVPQLLKDLRMGLTWAGVTQAEMDDFFKALEAIHLAHLRGKPTPAMEVAPAMAAEPATTAEPAVEQAPAAAGAETAAAADAGGLDAFLRVVDGMSMGLWVEFCEADDKRLRCKLAAVIKHTGKYIFVNRSGVKVAEKNREELAADLRDGRIELMEDSRLFDRALESVIGGSRQRKA